MIAERVPAGRILDVGYAQLPNPYLPRSDRHVTGFDLADDPSAGYDERIAGDIFDLDRLTAGRRFDCIVAGEFIEHVEQPYELLRLFSRALVPSGRLILSTPNPVSLPVVVFEWLRSTRRFYTSDHTYYFTPRWVARLIERSHFVSRRPQVWASGRLGFPARWASAIRSSTSRPRHPRKRKESPLRCSR